jgi:hypothetical protein
MRLHSLFRRRPSASLVVSFLALFVALGGAGYAATQLPANSVGTAQLQDASVTNHKLLNGSVGNFKLQFGSVGPRKLQNAAVGTAQINTSEVQARVTGTCATGSISSISATGTVTCASTPAQEYGTSSSTTTLGTGSTPVASKPLPTGSPFLVLAFPRVQVTGASGHQVEVDCTLTANGASLTRSLIVDMGTNMQAETIPLALAAPATTVAGSAAVTCDDSASTGSPTVDVATTINALQTAGNS